jgi:hypothetical protein
VVDPDTHPLVPRVPPVSTRPDDANLAVAERLRDLLSQGGAKVVMTRTNPSACRAGVHGSGWRTA